MPSRGVAERAFCCALYRRRLPRRPVSLLSFNKCCNKFNKCCSKFLAFYLREVPPLARPPACARSRLRASSLSDSQRLVSLQAQLPLRMREAIGHGAGGIVGDLRAVHRLEREPPEIEAGEIFRRCTGLRVDQLEFV